MSKGLALGFIPLIKEEFKMNLATAIISIGTIILTISCSSNMKKAYKQEVKESLKRTSKISGEVLTEKDIKHLPLLVQKYLHFTNAVGNEKVNNAFIKARGQIRSKPTDGWMYFESEQYNFFDNPLRAFYIKANKMGVPATGLHLYKNETASMQIKIAGLFTVVDAKGFEMNQGETVTVLNDMCFMAPASLIDKNITWETLDSLHVKARYKNRNITVSAILTFDGKGKLINFISGDRFETTDGKVYKNYPWETPVKEYGFFNGFILPAKADVIYKHPEGDFRYGEFILEDIKYNLQ